MGMGVGCGNARMGWDGMGWGDEGGRELRRGRGRTRLE